MFQSLNHTQDRGLNMYALCIAVESKRDGESYGEALVQITAWLRAHLRSLSLAIYTRLLPSSTSQTFAPGIVNDPDAENNKVAQQTRDLLRQLPFLPGLVAAGSTWHFVALTPDPVSNDQRTILWENLRLGSTDTPMGTYTVVACLQCLSRWSKMVYWPWFKMAVLGC